MNNAQLTDLPGIGPALANALIEGGFATVAEVADATPAALGAIPRVSARVAMAAHRAASELVAATVGLAATAARTNGVPHSAPVSGEGKPPAVDVPPAESIAQVSAKKKAAATKPKDSAGKKKKAAGKKDKKKKGAGKKDKKKKAATKPKDAGKKKKAAGKKDKKKKGAGKKKGK